MELCRFTKGTLLFNLFFIVAATGVFGLFPVSAHAATETETYKEVDVYNNAGTSMFGTIIIEEMDEQDQAFTDVPTSLTFTLLDGVQFPGGAGYAKMLSGKSTVSLVKVENPGKTSVTFLLKGSPGIKDKAVFDFGEMYVDSDYEGDVDVEIYSPNDSISADTVTIGTIMDSEGIEENEVDAINSKLLVAGEAGVNTGTLRITENDVKTLNGGTLTIKLLDGVSFTSSEPFICGGLLTGLVSRDRIDPVDGQPNWEITDHNRMLQIYLKNSTYHAAGFLDLTFKVNVAYDAEPGDLAVEVEGDDRSNVSLTTVSLGSIEQLDVALSVSILKNIPAGSWDETLGDVTINPNTDESILPGKFIRMELTNASFAGDIPRVTGLTLEKRDDHAVIWRVDKVRKQYAIKGLKIATAADADGDIMLEFSGDAGVAGSIDVAMLVPNVAASAENTPPVIKAGVQGASVADIQVQETRPGAFMGSKNRDREIVISCPDGVGFAARPVVVVAQGNVVLANNNFVYLRDKDGDGLDDEVYVIVEKESDVAAVIKFNNIRLDVYADFPDGPLGLNVSGSALASEESVAAFNVNNVATLTVAQVIAPSVFGHKNEAVFFVGKGLYTLNGSPEVMGVTPYIKNGRVYLPLRVIARVIGVPDEALQWDKQSKTATLTRDGKALSFTVGSKVYKSAGTDNNMDVEPEIYKGFLMLPARYVTEAFGGGINWNAGSQAVELTL